MTWYPESYLAQVPMVNMNMRANPARGYPGRTYRFYKGPVVFPFGHGLSYTSFANKIAHFPSQVSLPISAQINSTILSKTNALKVTHTDCSSLSLGLHVDVENTGTMDGTHTLLVFSTPPAGDWSADKQLVSFQKVHVPAGSKQRVMVGIHACKHFSVVDQFGVRRIPIGEHHIHVGEDVKHTISFQANLGDIIKP